MTKQAAAKSVLRREIRNPIRAQSADEIARASEKLNANLMNFLETAPRKFHRAAVYLATPREPNVDAFARQLQARGVLLCAPHSRENEKPFVAIKEDWSNIFLNARDWREPEYSNAKFYAADEMDLILVPALAFDKTGARLGQGGGWYDRALENLPARVLTIGVCFDFQIVESVPRETHDQIVSMIVTDERIIIPNTDEPEA